MSPSIHQDENLQGKEKAIFTVFSVMKLFENNIKSCKLVN